MPVGRPTKFKEEFIEQATKLCALGATDEEVADFFKVDVRTIHRWKLDNQAFCHALKLGKDECDDRVEKSLYNRAIGYKHEDIDIRVVEGKIVETTIIKHYPPETVAGIFWLKNRRPQQWRDKIQQEHSGADGGPIQMQFTSKDADL